MKGRSNDVRNNNRTNTILKILYVIIALTSFMLIRNYSYMSSADNAINNSSNSNNSSYTENYSNYSNSSFYDLEGVD